MYQVRFLTGTCHGFMVSVVICTSRAAEKSQEHFANRTKDDDDLIFYSLVFVSLHLLLKSDIHSGQPADLHIWARQSFTSHILSILKKNWSEIVKTKCSSQLPSAVNPYTWKGLKSSIFSCKDFWKFHFILESSELCSWILPKERICCPEESAVTLTLAHPSPFWSFLTCFVDLDVISSVTLWFFFHDGV